MSDLPPAERIAKLRTLEAWLDWQLHDTRRKIAALEQRVEQERPRQQRGQTQAPQRPPRPPAGTKPSTGYKMEPKLHPKAATPAYVHVADCTMANRPTSPVTAAEARLALNDPVKPPITEGCPFCDPGSQLEKEAASDGS